MLIKINFKELKIYIDRVLIITKILTKYIFAILIAISSFILPIIFVLIGFKGSMNIVADIAILQSILFMVFYPFNGNSRHYILNSRDKILSKNLLSFRIVLYLPLLIFSFLLAYIIIDMSLLTLILLTFIGSFSWLLEIYITNCEKKREYRKIILTIFLYTIAIAFIFFSEISIQNINYFCYFLILVNIPILFFVGLKNIKNISFKDLKKVFFEKIFNQIGGTTIIGLSTFTLKLLILLILPKEIAATIFLGYTIGGFLCTTITYSFMPSIIFNQFYKLKRIFYIGFFCALFVFSALILMEFYGFVLVDQNENLFLACILCSFLGSTISILAQYYKSYVTHIITNLNLPLYESVINVSTIIIVIISIYYFEAYGAVITYISSGVISLYIYKKLYNKLENNVSK